MTTAQARDARRHQHTSSAMFFKAMAVHWLYIEHALIASTIMSHGVQRWRLQACTWALVMSYQICSASSANDVSECVHCPLLTPNPCFRIGNCECGGECPFPGVVTFPSKFISTSLVSRRCSWKVKWNAPLIYLMFLSLYLQYIKVHKVSLRCAPSAV